MIHTADTTDGEVTNRALLSAESEKVHRLVLPLNMVVRDCVYLCLSDETLKAVGIGVNISERKSGTEQTKKREFVFFSTTRGATSTVVHRLDAKRSLSEQR